MPISVADKEFAAYVVDMMQSIGPVTVKGMFGGHGVFLEGLMFGLIADRVLYLKVDKESEKDFIVEDLEQFTYSKQGKAFKMSYYQAPEEALEEAESMNYWANKAYSAAVRVAAKKKKS